ncbi:polysaccharide deacetylase family protein [uncultured Sphingomonas sp.]|uniref:polysaccharide deacetylase family protein n=1 Tax=uncultured Sphingomonas sp. TaxID=158754 RepID=UPI0035CB9195
MPRRPFRPRAPLPADRIRWPADFGTRFVVFVDTEEEFDWGAPLARDNRSTSTVAALPAAHARFVAAGVPLALMVDYPVATDDAAIGHIAPLLAEPRTTVGAQLHPWVNPPYVEDLTPVNSFAGNLSRTVEAAKLDQLTAAITDAFGRRPVAYRAGRYGLGPTSIALLAERGYRIDCSMRPAHDYSAEGGPDFSAIGNGAFRLGGMVELPLTSVFTGYARGIGNALYSAAGRVPKGRGILARSGALSRVSLTPEGMPINEAIEAVRIAAGQGERVLSFAFHSPSLVPGHTPYVRDGRDLATFWRWWDRMLGALDRLDIRAAGLAEVIAAADQSLAASRIAD